MDRSFRIYLWLAFGITWGVGGLGLLAGAYRPDAAAAASRVLSSMLFGVSPTDRLTFLGIAALLIIVSLLAGAVPARRAAKTDPIQTLRDE
jgi:putative ABC transport system permease protein